MASTGKSVTIQIAPDDLETLKAGQYNLCFAKKVNDTYNVVWESASEYLPTNMFSWTPAYQLFGTNTFQSDVTVVVSTNAVNIGLGQQSTLDAAGVLGPPSTGGPSTGITMNNQFGAIHPGVSQLSTGVNGVQSTTPIYVAEDEVVIGVDTLTPKEFVMVWFQQNVEASTMFSEAVSNSVEIDLTTTPSATRLYQDGVWSTPPPTMKTSAFASVQDILKIVLVVTGAIIAQDLASKIASKLTGVYKDIRVSVTPGQNSNTFKVTYIESPNLANLEHSFVRTLTRDPVLSDTLMDFTVQSLAQLAVGYYSLTADAPKS